MHENYRLSSRQSTDTRAFNPRPSSNAVSNSYSLEQANITEADLHQTIEPTRKKAKQTANSLSADYQPADLRTAMSFKASRSYYIKATGKFKQISLLQNTKALKYFGLGPFFYIQFMRWSCWLFLFLTLLEGIRIYINWQSNGLSGYSSSFSTYFILASLGNFAKNSFSSKDMYIVALGPFAVLCSVFVAAVVWRCFFYCQIREQEENDDVKPEKYCLQIVSSNGEGKLAEEELQTIFSSFGPIHQISIVKSYDGKLEYFQQLERLEQKIKQQQLQLKLEGGGKSYLRQLKLQRQTYMKQLNSLHINPLTLSAYIHFEHESSKQKCLSFFNRYYLYNSCSHACMRNFCFCCIDPIPKKCLPSSGDPLLVKNQQVPPPQDINWQSFELTGCSLAQRYCLAVILILVFLVLSCTVIGLCTIYISTHSSNCDSVTIPATLADAQNLTNPTQIGCFCSANLYDSLTDGAVKSFCRNYLTDIYIEQGVQIAIILVSTVTNVLFGVVIDRLVDCTKPASLSQGLRTKTVIFTTFLIFNTIFLPILLYSNIFGFKASSYFSFIQLISADLGRFLEIDSLSFYVDYSPIWYRNVSAIFTNYLIFDILSVWVMFLFTRCRYSTAGLGVRQGKILQKHMNQQITSFSLSVYKEYSNFLMVFFMAIFLDAGIPALVPLAFIDILSRYLTNRSLLQHSSTRISGLGILFSDISHTFITATLALSGVNAGWMLTANASVYPGVLPFTVWVWGWNGWSVMERQLYLPFYLGVTAAAVGKYLLVGMVRCCVGACGESERKRVSVSKEKSFSEYKRTMNIVTSYNIKNNDQLRNAVVRMEMYMDRRH